MKTTKTLEKVSLCIWLVVKLSGFQDLMQMLEIAQSIVRKAKPDVVLMDIQMPHISGIEAMRLLKKQNPEVKILMQTIHDEEEKIFSAICSGANGYILKSSKPEQYLLAIEEVNQGGSHLSAGHRQQSIEDVSKPVW